MGYDDWFADKIIYEYGGKIRNESPRQYQTRITELKIMGIINSHKDGISHLRLAALVKINRKNLGYYMKRLMEKALVVRARGKQGKYYPATKGNRITSLTADLFSNAAAGFVLLDGEFPINSPFFKSKRINPDKLENALFIFSNKVGAIITYLLIQSMNPSNRFVDDSKNSEEKDLDIERWVDDAVSSLRPCLLPFLKEYTASLMTSNADYNGDSHLEKSGLNFLNYLYHPPLYLLNEKFISEFMMAFCYIYPSMASTLENIRTQLPRAVDRRINNLEYKAYCFKQQRLCKHVYEKPKNKILLAEYSNGILHCPKCHKTKKIESLYPGVS